MFKKFSMDKDKSFSVIDDNGNLIEANKKISFSNDKLIDIYKKMLFARQADLKAVNYQRQGRMYTYPPNLGQEAISVAAGLVVTDEDWVVPAFRELALWLEKGVSLKEIFMIFRGDEWGSHFQAAKRILPISVPIASQLVHATGLGYSLKYNKEKNVVFAFVGDGGTSEGDFHEALNFAAVWKVPVIFIIQNNQFAISVPVSEQTASKNLAIKSQAYGIPGIKVDGNDVFAMYQVLRESKDYAVEGKGPVLIEAVTYRKGAHTTSDDPSRYRSKEEENEWGKKDPLSRLQSYLNTLKILDKIDEEKLKNEFNKKIDLEFEQAENVEYKLDDVFDYNYTEIPEELKKQKEQYRQYLKWQGGKR